MLARTKHSQNLLFGQRVFLKKGNEYAGAGSGDTWLINYEMLSLTLMIWKHKDRFANVDDNFEWLTNAIVRYFVSIRG